MSANTFGHIFKFTSFGESHGPGLGAVIEGVPAGVFFKPEIINDFLSRRRPGVSALTTARNESDDIEILSGIFENKTLGTPISIIVRNHSAQSQDYDQIKSQPRAGHADQVWREKFGHSDHRGGGRSSGRETVARVIAGAFAKMMLLQKFGDIQVSSVPKSIGPIHFTGSDYSEQGQWGLAPSAIAKLTDLLATAKVQGESFGGVAVVKIANPPKNLGQPVFHKLKSDLAAAMLSIGAVTGFELGTGFDGVHQPGTIFHNDPKNYGGIQGGISTGQSIEFSLAIKPTSSILDVAKKGRHDPCILLRALVVFEAMTWCVLADHWQWSRLDQI